MVWVDDVRKLFLQAVMSRRIITEKLARTILLKCIDAVKGSLLSTHFWRRSFIDISHTAINNTAHIAYQDSSQSWNAFVDELNKLLDPLDLELRHTMDEIRGLRVYALVRLIRTIPSHDS